MMKLTSLVLSTMLVAGDVYMHMPRGSNNRLNEKSANRNNGNRLFDSQNNNRGGYNVGDKTDQAFNPNQPEATLAETYSLTDNTPTQYPMTYFEGSILPVEWTNQHGCGGNEENDPHKLNCNMVIQYTCDSEEGLYDTNAGMYVRLADGGNTNTPDAPTNFDDIVPQQQDNNGNQRGRHESEGYYYECQNRKRNYGLFTADQNLNKDDARSTRQNPNGNRRGLECPEERDYYPYWQATPWRDVAYVTDEVDQMCGPNGYIAKNSQNLNDKYKCLDVGKDQEIPITKATCEAKSGKWTAFNHGLKAPECYQAQWTRVNHLGNNRRGQPVTYNWTLPTMDDLIKSGAKIFGSQYARCVVRLRYNISTDDYDPWNTNSTMNQQNGQKSPVEQNPTMPVRLGGDLQGLRLAINTAQFGRTFQDRSHVFTIKARPASMKDQTIYNLNVRGKRGNIVQTFPAVEYDFVPNRLHLSTKDLIHVQWTGSNTHNNGNPAGDGQAGDAGEGTGGTDRSNMVQIGNMDTNYPMPLDTMTDNMWTASTCRDFNGVNVGADWKTCALIMATSGQFRSWADVDEDEWNVTLDQAPASLVGGVVMQFTKSGEFNYIGSRNNNFSNRSQKGVLIVE